MHLFQLENSVDDKSNIEVFQSTIDLLYDRKNVNIVLNPMAAMEDMGTYKQHRIIFGNAQLPFLKFDFKGPASTLWRWFSRWRGIYRTVVWVPQQESLSPRPYRTMHSTPAAASFFRPRADGHRRHWFAPLPLHPHQLPDR